MDIVDVEAVFFYHYIDSNGYLNYRRLTIYSKECFNHVHKLVTIEDGDGYVLWI